MPFKIIYSPEAVEHLAALAKATQVIVVDQIDEQLTHAPMLPSRKGKLLRPNPIAPWELRLGDVRVFYAVAEEPEARSVSLYGWQPHGGCGMVEPR